MKTTIPEIPATATEEYLEKLTEKIYKRLEGASSQASKKRLHLLLETVEKRKQQLPQPTRTLPNGTSDTLTKTPLDILETAKLSPEQHAKIKSRLENVLADIKQQRVHAPHETLTQSFSEKNDEIPSQALLETSQLTEHEYELVKQRMTEMLAEIGKQHPSSDQKSAEENEIIELGQELEIEEKTGGEREDELFDLGPEQEIEAFLDAQELETLKLPTTPDQQLPLSDQEEGTVEKTDQDDIELDADGNISFEAACRRVGTGESLVLFEKTQISEREQLMVEAFKEHLTQLKGLKRQQIFDMQHLTARSIRELEQIFKTYHLQGYLRAELNNIYNRLLNLRSRFSILQH